MPRDLPPRLRLMLVELVPHEPERVNRSQAYPWLMGLAERRGWKSWWRVLGVRYEPTLLYALEPGDLKALLAEVRRRKPEVLVVNERLREDQRALLAGAGARLVYCSLETAEDLSRFAGFVGDHISLSAEAEGPGLLDAIEPVFRRERLNDSPWLSPPFIRVLSGTYCSYLTRAADNPFYRDLKLPSATMSCSFCDSGPGKAHARPFIGDAASFAARQVLAACAQRASGERLVFEVSGSELWRRLEDFIDALVKGGAKGAELLFMPRVDDLLAAREAVGRCLPRLAESGLSMRVYGMSVENFSEAENRRLNKGITAEQVHEAAAFMLETSRRWPERFLLSPGGLSMILFTPWTTLEDLRVNLENIERCSLIDPSFALSRRLQLFPGRPVTLLAERDGLLAKDRRDPFYNAGCMTGADQDDLPWRFLHPDVEVLWRLARRLSCDGPRLPAGDPESREVASFLARAGGEAARPLAVFRRAVEAAARRPGLDSVSGLLERLEPGAPARRDAPGPRRQPGRDGLAFLKELLGGPPAGWALEKAAFTSRSLDFSLVNGPRRLDFEAAPQPRRGPAGGELGVGLRCAREDLAEDERALAAELAAGLAAASFGEVIARLRRDDLLYSDSDGGRLPSRLERYYRVVDHTPDFWKFVYPQWRCLEEKVNLGAHWARINYATLECRFGNPNAGSPSLRFFADEGGDEAEDGCRSVEADITEADVVGGRTQELLGRSLDEVARREKPAYIHLNTTCMPELLGDTPAPFIGRIEAELGVPVFWTSKTRPGGPLYSTWIERLLDETRFSARRDPRAVLLAGVASPAARAQAEELCAALGVRVLGTIFPDLDFRRTPGMREASAVVWLDPVGWEAIGDGPFLRHDLAVVRHHPPYGVAGTRAWLGRVASVLGLEGAEAAFARVLESRAAPLDALRAECRRRTAALIGDAADIELLAAQRRVLGFSAAALLGELGFDVRCLVFGPGGKADAARLRRARAPSGAGTIEFVPFSSRAQLDRLLAGGVDLVFSHFNHDPRL
ncbi:MAG: nitrogenase component 1, partial [Elusimicrobia bacterium]|nr:nitrogenase component 1 [Elusimicrobiota bacterium]